MFGACTAANMLKAQNHAQLVLILFGLQLLGILPTSVPNSTFKISLSTHTLMWMSVIIESLSVPD